MNIYEVSTKPYNQDWRAEVTDKKRSGPARVFQYSNGSRKQYRVAVLLSPPPNSWFRHAKFLLKSVSVPLFNLHAVGGVWLLLVPRGCLAGWVLREPRAVSYLTFPGRGKNES